MKISILGTNGFLSNAIGQFAIEKGWQLDMYGLAEPTSVDCDRFFEINLMNKDLDCTSMLDSNIIIYAIGAGIQSNLSEGANLIYELNVTAPVNICNILKELGYNGIFVTFGSYFELGEANIQRPATEEDIINAMAPAPTDYVVSKRMLTRFVSSYKHEFIHWHFILPTIYGPGENPRRLIPYTINAIRNNEELSFTSGEQMRQYLFVEDVAKALHVAFVRNLPTGVYNVAGNEVISVRQLVKMICDAEGKKYDEACFGIAQRSDVGMKYLSLDSTKLFAAIGFHSNTSVSEQISLY